MRQATLGSLWVLVGSVFGMLASCEADLRQNAGEGTTGSDPGSDQDTAQGSDLNSGTDTGFGTNDGAGTSASGDGCDRMDILFIIDNSESMTEEQASLVASFPQFINVLRSYKNPNGEPVGFRVGVTTTGVTRKFKETNGLMQNASDTYSVWCDSSAENCVQDGILQGQEKCGLAKPWIESESSGLSKEFECAAAVGIKGSWMEMPFAALELALGEQSAIGQPNHGFYRREGGESLLAVVIITDEDDCSVEQGGVLYTATEDWMPCDGTKGKGVYQAAQMKTFLDDLTGGPGRYVVVGIAGPGPKMCQSDYGLAKHGKRIKELTDACQNSVFGDICAGDLSSSLAQALELMTATCDALPPLV